VSSSGNSGDDEGEYLAAVRLTVDALVASVDANDGHQRNHLE
jgi:hypothetical protein